jgi:hypothetical protein
MEYIYSRIIQTFILSVRHKGFFVIFELKSNLFSRFAFNP